MVIRFQAAMAKLAVLGQNVDALTDCSEVIPIPSVAQSNVGTLPAGKTLQDIEGSVSVVHILGPRFNFGEPLPLLVPHNPVPCNFCRSR